ncbi:MAG: phosphate signaling complex protein PhoU [Alphaproteobacteria bacterium]|nr:phosphate signaling complex protein PhoU [Alphaproteobacteria bacterium]
MALQPAHSTFSARRQLEVELSRMAALVESQLQGAITAFERRDVAAAENLIPNDARVNEFDRDIETRVMALLAAELLPAELLREVMTIMKLTGELERVGDLAKNIAKRTLVVSREAPSRPAMGVARMGRASLRQFSDILDAYATRNLDAAKAVWGGDDEVDELYNSVFQEITLAMIADSSKVNACTHLVFIAKNFERVGDHATNIAEAIYFLETGSPFVESPQKSDEAATGAAAPPRQSGGAFGMN